MKLEGELGGPGVWGLAWVEGPWFCANALSGSGDHQKFETKPRSLQDNYQD